MLTSHALNASLPACPTTAQAQLAQSSAAQRDEELGAMDGRLYQTKGLLGYLHASFLAQRRLRPVRDSVWRFHDALLDLLPRHVAGQGGGQGQHAGERWGELKGEGGDKVYMKIWGEPVTGSEKG